MRISIRLELDEFEALGVLARQEHRDPRDEASILVRRQLQTLALLKLSEAERAAQKDGAASDGNS